MYIHAYLYIDCIYTYIYLYIQLKCIYVCVCVFVSVYTYMYIHVCACVILKKSIQPTGATVRQSRGPLDTTVEEAAAIVPFSVSACQCMERRSMM